MSDLPIDIFITLLNTLGNRHRWSQHESTADLAGDAATITRLRTFGLDELTLALDRARTMAPQAPPFSLGPCGIGTAGTVAALQALLPVQEWTDRDLQTWLPAWLQSIAVDDPRLPKRIHILAQETGSISVDALLAQGLCSLLESQRGVGGRKRIKAIEELVAMAVAGDPSDPDVVAAYRSTPIHTHLAWAMQAAGMDDSERMTLCVRWGLDTTPGTLDEIGVRLGLTRQRAEQLEKAARTALIRYSHALIVARMDLAAAVRDRGDILPLTDAWAAVPWLAASDDHLDTGSLIRLEIANDTTLSLLITPPAKMAWLGNGPKGPLLRRLNKALGHIRRCKSPRYQAGFVQEITTILGGEERHLHLADIILRFGGCSVVDGVVLPPFVQKKSVRVAWLRAAHAAGADRGQLGELAGRDPNSLDQSVIRLRKDCGWFPARGMVDGVPRPQRRTVDGPLDHPPIDPAMLETVRDHMARGRLQDLAEVVRAAYRGGDHQEDDDCMDPDDGQEP